MTRTATKRRREPKAPRTRSLADLWNIEAIEPDGLLITAEGQYVRVIECQRVPNVVSADEQSLSAIEDGWAELASAIPDFQGLSFYAQTDPIPIADALEEDRRRVGLAVEQDLEHENEDLARTRRRLLSATTQSVAVAARGDQPAVAARYWVAVPWNPVSDNVRDRAREAFRPRRGGALTTTWARHRKAAGDSQRYCDQVVGHLSAMGVDPHIMGAVEILAGLWERAHPAAEHLPDFDALAEVPRIVSSTTPEDAAQHRQAIAEAITGGDDPVGIDASDMRWLRHADGTLEETLHIGTPPMATSPWWLSHLLQVPMPCTVAVHIRVGDRSRVRHRQRLRWSRLEAALDYKTRRGRVVGADERETVQEAVDLDQELSTSTNATLYDVSILASFRHLGGVEHELDDTLRDVTKTFASITDARILRGRGLNLPGFTSTLPIGVDRLRARRTYAHRNIPHCVPLATASCGSPEGLILGFSDPGGTLERVDPFDALYSTHVTLIAGPSGGGKTVCTNALLSRAVSQGMRGWIIDRSTTRSEDGATRVQGHYDTLNSLIPGARKVQVGGGDAAADVICPWDVRDPSDVPSDKLEFLLAFHALLIGDVVGGERRLGALEESLLSRAISAVYLRCAQTDEPPRETLLVEELERIVENEPDTSATLGPLQSLIARLHPYVRDGALAHIADRPTTVQHDAPLTLFDIAGTPDRLAPALILAIVDHIDHEVQSTRARRASGTLDDLGPWAGRMFLVVEEGWKLTSSHAAGAWLNEYARRSRHYALWLIFVSQHFKDLDNEQGRAMLENSRLRLCFKNAATDLEYARDAIGLTDTDIQTIETLRTRKGVFSSVYVVSDRGRGRVRVVLGDAEYWTCSNDPERDQPKRAAALRETDGDPWKALRLLCTPSWHDRQR